MSQPVLVDAVRTPFGKRAGVLAAFHAAELLGAVQAAVVGEHAAHVDQVVGGCVTPAGEQYGGIVRTAWLHAGLPAAAACTTIDAQCSTSLQSALMLAGQIATGAVDVGVACGVEVMSRVPLTPKTGLGLGTPRPADWAFDLPDQFTAADRIAALRGFSRAELDAFGLRSQQRARAAWDAGAFDGQVVALKTAEGELVERDQGLRETSLDALAALRPTRPGGLHTAGTSSQVSDGASAALLTSATRAAELGLRPRARFVAQCAVGGDTELMLDGPVAAAARVLERTGLTIADIDVFEVNEAFASIPMSFARAHDVPEDRLNVHGGAIALGHPAGATGIRLLAGVVDELERRDGQLAMIAICAAAVTTCAVVERV